MVLCNPKTLLLLVLQDSFFLLSFFPHDMSTGLRLLLEWLAHCSYSLAMPAFQMGAHIVPDNQSLPANAVHSWVYCLGPNLESRCMGKGPLCLQLLFRR